MSDLNTEIKIGADASGVEAGVGRAKKSLADLGGAATKAGASGRKSIEEIGYGGDKAAAKVEAATRNMQGSIQRLIAEQKSGAKGSREYYEALADQRGINRNALKPLLDQLDDAKRKTDAAKNSADDWRSSLGKINGAAVGAAIAAAAVGIGAMVTKTIDAADSFSKLSAKSGVAVESLRELNYAASLSDVSTESLGVGLRKLSQNMALAAGGSKLQAAAFDAIGVSLKAADGSLKSADTMLKELSSKFATFKDGPEKAALAIALFGKQGAEMIPLLNGGAAGLAEMADEANRLGIVFDGDLAKNAEAFNDNLTRMQTSVQGAVLAITKEMLPTLNKLAQAFVDSQDNSKSFATWLGGGLRTVVEAATILISDVKFVLEGFGREIGAIGAQFAALARGDFSGWTAISDAVKADGVRAKAELDKFQFDLLNARFLTSKAGAGRGTAPDPRSLGIGEGTVAPIVPQGTGDAVKKVVSEYDKLIQKLSLELPKAAAEAEAAQNGYNKAQTEFVALANSPAWAKFTNQQRANVAALFENKIASEQAADATKALNKANEEAGKAREKYLTSLDTGLDKIQADIAAQNEATARMGLSKEAIAELDAAKLEMLATDLELQAIKALDRNLDQQTYDALKKQAAAYRELGIAKKGGAAKEAALDLEKANADAAKKSQEDWERAAEQINSSLTDALLRGFESGKDFAKNLRDTVVNMFKTMVLRPVISAVLSPVSGAISGVIGGGQSSGGGLLGGIQTASNLNSLYGAGSQALFGGAAGASAASLGYANIVGAAGGDAIGALATANGMWAGVATGAQAAAQSAIAANLALEAGTAVALPAGTAAAAAGTGAAAGGISGALGAIPGWGWALAAVAGIASLLSKPKTYHTGGAGSYSDTLGVTLGPEVRKQGITSGVADKNFTSETNLASATISKSIVGLLNSTAKTFGKDAGYFAATAFADDKSKDGAWGSLLIKRLDDTIVNWADTQTSKWAPKVFADGDAGKAEYMQQLAASTKQAILSIGLPEWAQRIAQSMPDSGSMEDLSAMLAQIQGYPAQLLQAYGTSRDDLVNLFVQGLQSGNAQAAGQSVADTLVGSIQNAVYGQAAGQIFDIVNMGIVTPMLDAIATGASVSEALSQATIDATIKRAKEQAAVLAELFGNAEFQGALEQIRTAVGSALGGAGSYIAKLPNTLQSLGAAVAPVADTIDDTAKKIKDITDGLIADRDSLAIDLLRAQGLEEAALKAERALAIKGMDAYQIGLYDANTGTRALIDSLTKMREISEQLASELPGVVSKFLTPEQNTANSYGAIAGDLIKAGLSGMGVGALTQALTGASKDEIAQAAVAVYNMTGVADEMRLALVRAAGSLADLKTEAEGMRRNETDAAMAALEKAVNARKALLQESIDDIRAVFEAVRDNARALYGEVESTARGMADAGRAFIDNAISAAKLTGYLPDGKALSEAIGSVRNGIGETQYKTQIDADRDRLVLAGKLSQLQVISGDQLTEAENQLKALDDILSSSHAQIDALRGIDASVMSVEAAIAALSGAMGREKAGGGGGGGGGGKPGSTQTVGGADTLHGANGAQYGVKSGMGYQSGTGLPWFADDIRAIAADLVNAGNGKQVYDMIKAEGYTLSQANTILGLGEGTAEDWARAMGLPVFHNGTPYVPRTGFALLEQGEAVIPRAANNGGGNAEVVAELKALRVSNERLESRLKAIEQSNENMAVQQTNYTEDGNAARVEIMNVKALAVEIAKEMA